MPRKAKQQPTPASAPYPQRLLSQMLSPLTNPNATRLTVSDIEVLLYPKYGGQVILSTFAYDSQENRAIMDAVRNRGIAPATTIANTAARTESKESLPPSSSADASAAGAHYSSFPSLCTVAFGFGAFLEAPYLARVFIFQSLSCCHFGLEVEPTTEGLLQGLRHSTDYVRAQSSKLSATTPCPASPVNEEHLDSKESVKYILELLSVSIGIFQALSSTNWKSKLLEGFPALMDDNLDVLHEVFIESVKRQEWNRRRSYEITTPLTQ
ncbi:hypothetical protein AGABI1DRAFT_95926 [Agaricus bisporus var. burnettii JB137-S8]|uniref:Uncharacterized protein n=1 Tax=Agaricus bisporus var. burnettii (strain JB137-S8 / ATCC MYA-4627 / FGSC 10392) TaxID=597362 RepID=K5WTF2_AGABU|nr:uncharacterized protein AGABI1DRAFT_95926 [Agaricus bisporus var. burnettii JB137-S8]EKM74023.1 hypothetical protein AGABI1DRAFT_95926 [Agaricus bisporus var. burnettii JB137-S8]